MAVSSQTTPKELSESESSENISPRKKPGKIFESLKKPRTPVKQTEGKLKERPEDEENESENESLGVFVKAKVSLTEPDSTIPKKQDKNERKRKWKGVPKKEEPEEDVEMSSVLSVEDAKFKTDTKVQTPRDFISAEGRSPSVNVELITAPQTEISINVQPKEKLTLGFIETERQALTDVKKEPKDRKNKDRKEVKSPVKTEADKGFSSKKHPTDENDAIKKLTPLKKPSADVKDKENVDVGVTIQMKGDKAENVSPTDLSRVSIDADITVDPNDASDEKSIMYQIIRRQRGTKPGDEEKYKVSVDVKVKSGDSPTKKFLIESRRRSDVLPISEWSPPEQLKPEEFASYLERVSNTGKDRLKKMQNIKDCPRTWVASSDFDLDIVTPERIQADIDKLKDAIARNDYILIQRMFFWLIKNIDEWLETIQYVIIVNRPDYVTGPNQNNVKNLKNLKDEVSAVDEILKEFFITLKKAPKSSDSDIVYQLRTYLQELEPQMSEIQAITKAEEENVTKDLSRWEEFLNGVNNVSVIVEEIRQNFDRLVESDRGTNSKLKELEKIEASNEEYMDRAAKLISLAKDLAKDFPNREIPLETYTTFELTKNIQNSINVERERLLQLQSLADEYEQTLKEFAQIIEVADNLVDSPITITSLQHLQDEMQKHRKFFVNLSHCRAILESLESNLDGDTRGIRSELHKNLYAKASVILDKAASRAQQMAMAASKWTVLDKGVRNEQQWLQVAHQRLPDLQQVTSSDYDQYISLYQSLAADAAIHHAKILQLTEVANNLQDVITCVGLESFYDDYLNVILKIQEEIDDNLEKLLAFQVSFVNSIFLIRHFQNRFLK